MKIHLDQHHLQALRDYQPRERSQHSLMKAAVALILRDGEHGTEVLLMQRASHPKDPWSGQMSFPGGKIDPVDDSSKAAAIREAFEEVGALLRDEDCLGQLDDVYGLKGDAVFTVHIACFVFKPMQKLSLIGNDEVADMVWVPLAYFNDPENAHAYTHSSGFETVMPAVMIDRNKSQVLWGLTLRVLSNFYRVLDLYMAVLTDDERQALLDIEKREVRPEIAKMIEKTFTQKEHI